MAADIVLIVLLVFGLSTIILGFLRLGFVPLALIFEVRDTLRRRRWRARMAAGKPPWQPSVTVVVPGYNEERVIGGCVRSILNSDYADVEVVLVDDGSTDDTFAMMQTFAEQHHNVTALTQVNAGKGAALNRGIAASHGEVVVLVDSDGLFLPETLEELVIALANPRVGAVCGDDRPVNADRVQTKFMTLISHVGTGLARRSLHLLRSLPVVSGNNGAFRRSALEAAGPLREDTLGEDLELTWRIHKAGYRVNFAPRALVYAESPSTVRGLWKQRVRWGRGLIQGYRMHPELFGNPRYGLFGISLALNFLVGIALPLLMIAVLPVVATLLVLGQPVDSPTSGVGLLLWLGLPVALGLAVVAALIDRSPGDLRYLWTFPIWPIYSFWANFVMAKAVWLELRNAPNRWNKLQRTGVITVDAARRSAGSAIGPGA